MLFLLFIFQINECFNEDSSESERTELKMVLDSYVRTGNDLSTAQSITTCRRVKDHVQRLQSSEFPMPFIFVGDSSGTGKTQLAFALNAAYIPMTRPSRASQIIYRCFSSWSELLLRCADSDAQTLNRCSMFNFSMDNLRFYDGALFLPAFANFILDHHSPTWPGDQPNLSFSSHLSRMPWLDVLKRTEQKPCIAFDEVITGGDQKKIETTTLVRNLFRLMRFPTILLGTESKVSNLYDLSAQSRGAEHPFHWVTIFSRLDPPTDKRKEEWIRIIRDVFDSVWEDFLIENMHSCRPLLMELFATIIQRHKSNGVRIDLDGVCAETGEMLLSLKGKRASTLLGQVKMTMSYDINGIPSQWLHTRFIHEHFAHLIEWSTESGQVVLNLSSDEILNGNSSWHPYAKFPTCSQEPLLYLCLGGVGHPAFSPLYIESKRKSAWDAYCLCHVFNADGLIFGNEKAPVNDGTRLEALIASAAYLSSHEHGIHRKLSVADWLPYFFTEIGSSSEKVAAIRYMNMEVPLMTLIQNQLNNFYVPFLSPPNSSWPESMLRMGDPYRFGTLTRPSNSANTDVIISSERESNLIRIECKDWKGPLAIEALNGALERATAPVNFIVIDRR